MPPGVNRACIRGIPRARVGASLALVVLLLWTPPGVAEPRRWTTVAGKCQVSFTATFALGDFTGQTDDVSGDFQGDASDLRQGIQGAVRINPAAIRTGIDGRDRDMREVLEVTRYPEIRFTLERVEPSFPSVTDRADVLLTITGRMLIHGVERAMTFPGRVRLRDERLWVRGEGPLTMSAFGVKPPTKLLFKVADTVQVSFDLVLGPKD